MNHTSSPNTVKTSDSIVETHENSGDHRADAIAAVVLVVVFVIACVFWVSQQ